MGVLLALLLFCHELWIRKLGNALPSLRPYTTGHGQAYIWTTLKEFTSDSWWQVACAPEAKGLYKAAKPRL